MLLARVLALTVLCSPITAQRVWVVDPVPGPGIDFTVIQDAIDAASDGDTVLVHAGSYAGFAITGKAVFVHADIGGASVVGSGGPAIAVDGTAPGQQVVVRGFVATDYLGAGISVTSCQGPVLIEDCSASDYDFTFVVHAAFVGNTPRATFTRCQLIGGRALRAGPGSGLTATAATVVLHASTVRGGAGSYTTIASYSGGSGANLVQASIIASGSSIVGGDGDPGFSFQGVCLSLPTGGGIGIVTDSGSSVFAFASTIAGGIGGGFDACAKRPDGVRIVGQGTRLEIAGTPTTLTTQSPARAGQTVALDLTGPVGANAFLLLSPLHNPFFVRGCVGTVAPDLGLSLTVPVGAVPGSGQLSVPLPIPASLGVQSITLYFQAATILGPSCALGDTSALLVLDAGF